MRRGLDGFADDVRAWRAGTPGRAPVYHRLLEEAVALFDAPTGATEQAARARVEAAWRERKQPNPYHRPLLLMAALRAEALRAGTRHPLFEAIGAAQPRPDAATRDRLAAALGDAPPRLFADLATRSVQTNETSRAVAWLWPAALAGGGRPLALYDLGCSAGLNLAGDRLPSLWTDPRGAALPVAAGARIASRQGFDTSPLDVARDADRAWLVACVWPGEAARLERLQAAIDAFRALAADPTAPPRLAMSDLADVPERLEALARGAAGPTLHLAYQTVVRDYLSEATRARYVEGMRRWVAGGDARSPRIWVELETPPGAGSMAIEAHVGAGTSGGVLDLTLAWCGFHPDRVTPEADAVRAFTAATAAR
ncbi:MAG TPA: DUF2332 family protein [Polyangia bacterium]|nr:DUF2332 family protein [Polyangia bacterium]